MRRPAPVIKQHRKTAGYTLLELAAVFTIAGMIMAASAQTYRVYVKTQGWENTINNVELAVNALDGYLARYGRYPCPSRLNAQRTDADYGMEGDCTNTAVAVGTCASGICVEESQRTDLGAPPPRVRRGALPFRVLNIPEERSVDGYNTRIQYAVTERLTQAITYDRSQGGISVVDERPVSVSSPANSVHFVVFSTGPNFNGAYSKAGQVIFACNAATMEGENCNTSAANSKAIYRLARQSTQAGASYFDDILKFYSSVNTPLWRTADQDVQDIATMDSNDSVGVGMNPTTAKLQISGVTKADQFDSDLICNPDDSACFTVEKIAGNDPDMTCTTNATQPYVNKIWGGGVYGKVNCTAVPSFTCPPGQIMVGVDSAGKLKCSSTNPGCPALPTTICDESGPAYTQYITIPAGTYNQTYTAVPTDLTPGDPTDYQSEEYWKCTAGQWKFTGWNGKYCICTPQSSTVTKTCVDWYGGGVAGTFTGDVTTQYTRTCPDNTQTSTQLSNTCMCTPTSQTRSATCPLGFTGTRTEQRNWTCTATPTVYPYGSWGGWTETANNCVCQPTTDSQIDSCPQGWTGEIHKHRDLDCTTVTWSPWIIDSNSCTCAAGQTQTQSVGCSTLSGPNRGPGYVGNVVQTRTFDCASSTWGAWTDVSDTCTAGSNNWVPLTTPDGPYASPLVPEMAWDACSPAGSVGSCSQPTNGGYYFYSTCSCQ